MQRMPASAHGAADVDCPLDWGCLKSLKPVLQALNASNSQAMPPYKQLKQLV